MSEPGLNGDRLIDLSRYTHRRGDDPFKVVREAAAVLDFLATLAAISPFTPIAEALRMASKVRNEAA